MKSGEFSKNIIYKFSFPVKYLLDSTNFIKFKSIDIQGLPEDDRPGDGSYPPQILDEIGLGYQAGMAASS
jgi:hypothetical protein